MWQAVLSVKNMNVHLLFRSLQYNIYFHFSSKLKSMHTQKKTSFFTHQINKSSSIHFWKKLKVTHIISGLILRRLKSIEQARTASQSINYALIIKWVRPENLQLITLIDHLFITWSNQQSSPQCIYPWTISKLTFFNQKTHFFILQEKID